MCGISQLNVGQCQKAFLPSVGAAEKKREGVCTALHLSNKKYPVSVHFPLSVSSLWLLFMKTVSATIKHEISSITTMEDFYLRHQSKVSILNQVNLKG